MSLRQEVLRAFAELQLRAIDPAPAPILDDPAAVAADVMTYLNGAPHLVAEGFGLALDRIDWTARTAFGLPFAQLGLPDRRSALDRVGRDQLGQTLLTMLARASWLVIYSREPARRRVGFSRSADLPPPADVPSPDAATLQRTYDVCVVGSGAGGSVVAARLAAAGRDVLLIDEGAWVNPKSYSARDDRALNLLYRDSGIQPALPGPGLHPAPPRIRLHDRAAGPGLRRRARREQRDSSSDQEESAGPDGGATSPSRSTGRISRPRSRGSEATWA